MTSDRRPGLSGLVHKRGHGHQLALADQAGAGKPAEGESLALSKPDRRSGRTRGTEQQLDEVTRVIDRWQPRLGGVERVERVALNERAVKGGERLDLADVV